MTQIIVTLIAEEKGSSKSGNYGHAGRPGKLGGSVAKGSGAGGMTGQTNTVSQGTTKPDHNIAPPVKTQEQLAKTEYFGWQGGEMLKGQHFSNPVQKVVASQVGVSKPIPLGGSSTLPTKGTFVKFEGVRGYHKISGMTDKAIEKKLADLQKATGKRLTKDPRTDFPSFSIYQNGEEIGGG